MSTENQYPAPGDARVGKAARPFWKKKRFIIPAAFVALIVVGSAAGASGNKTQTPAAVASATATATVATSKNTPTATPTPTQTKTPTPVAPPPPPAPKVPAEYQSALSKASSYFKNMHLSKAGIYDQLTSPYGEKFSAEAAQYAIDNLNVDYNAAALAKAKSYQTNMSMSPAAIYDQLVSAYGEKFTPAEAQWAIDHLGG